MVVRSGLDARPHLIGRDPDAREIWPELRREVRAYDHTGHGSGLGVAYDWDFIEQNRVTHLVFGRAK